MENITDNILDYILVVFANIPLNLPFKRLYI